jgi:hypothetical protein
MAMIESIREQMKERLDKYKTKLETVKASHAKTQEEVTRLRKVLHELQKEKTEAFERERQAKFRSSAASAMASASAAASQSAAEREEILARRRAELRRELVAGLELLGQDDVGEGAFDASRSKGASGWLGQLQAQWSHWWYGPRRTVVSV